MFAKLQSFFRRTVNALMLESYGWQQRQGMYQGKWTVQWQDPNSLHWYSENTALRLMRVQALEQLQDNSR